MDAKPLFPRWVTAIAVALAVAFALYGLRSVLTPIFFAFLIAYMLDPVVDRLETWKLPRAAAITLLLVVVGGVFFVFLLLVLPGVVRDVADVAKELPAAARRAIESWEPILESYGIPVPHSFSEMLEQFSAGTEDMARDAITPAAAALRGVVGGTASALSAAVGLLMIPVFSFYLLYDFDRMVAAIGDLIPRDYRAWTGEVATEVDEVLGQWIRGQLLVMFVLAVLYAVGYSLVGIRLAIPIGIVAGLLSFIPYVGGGLALALAVGMCAFDFQGWGQLGGVVVVYGIVQTLEGFVITPKIVGDKVGLSAVWVLFALMVAGEVLGFMGVLLAVPAAAVVKIFVVRGVRAYKGSSLYWGSTPPAQEEEDDEQVEQTRDGETKAPAQNANDTKVEPGGEGEREGERERERKTDAHASHALAPNAEDADVESERKCETDADVDRAHALAQTPEDAHTEADGEGERERERERERLRERERERNGKGERQTDADAETTTTDADIDDTNDVAKESP
ncbi:MAG: AI-2E family transporter [Myxococcota bacterium]